MTNSMAFIHLIKASRRPGILLICLLLSGMEVLLAEAGPIGNGFSAGTVFEWDKNVLLDTESKPEGVALQERPAETRVRHYLFLPLPVMSLFRYETVYGTEAMLTAHSMWSRIDNGIIPTSLPFLKEDTFLTKTANILYRMTKLFVLDYPIHFMMPSLIHEFFGHGMRAYQIGFSVTSIQITLPPPFAFQFPSVSTHRLDDTKSTNQQHLLLTIGGSEANLYTAGLIRRNVLLSGYFDYHTSFLYLYANNDLNGYAAFAAEVSDIDNYKYTTSELYGKKLDNTKLLAYGLTGILGDPLNYYSFYNIFREYLYDGNRGFRIPWIPLSNKLQLHYLPKLAFNFTPYGVELSVHSYVKYKETLYSVVVGFSDGTFDPSWRMQAKVWNIPVTQGISFDVEAEIWVQPKIKFYLSDELKESGGLGGQIYVTYNHDNIVSDYIGFMLQIGYKSSGYAQGEPLENRFVARTAVTVSF